MAGLNKMMMRPEKFTLKDPISLEELYELMARNETDFPGRFRLKKGLFGKSIVFDIYMTIKPSIRVKDNIVKITALQQSSSVKVGNMPSIDIKATKQVLQATKEGGLGKALTGGPEYYNSIADTLRELLQGRMQ